MGNFSTAKDKIMGSWYELLEKADNLNRIRLIIDGGDMCFFFMHDNKLYGSGESSRVMFAKLKDPKDEENTPAWRKEALFTATNLFDLLHGNKNSQGIFGEKEYDSIDVVTSRDDVIAKCQELLK